MKQESSKYLLRKVRLTVGIMMLAGGIYILLLLFAPSISPSVVDRSTGDLKSTFEAQEIRTRNNEIVIPKISVDHEFKAGDASVLDDFVWWRHEDRGDPVNGGNFILSAHRFRIGLTPGATIRKSPFYNIDKLVVGDDIIIYYEGQKYEYEISKKYGVKPNAIEIEAPSDTAKLTLYSCTFKGASDGRDVIEATLKET